MKAQQRNLFFLIMCGYFIIVGSIFYQSHGLVWLIDECVTYGHFFMIGLGGAIIANATGAGGGIVFIPAFSAMGISQSEALATSILIQCFGMTAGSIAWFLSFKKRPNIYQRYQPVMRTIIISTGLASITGVLLGEYMIGSLLPFSMTFIFSMLSICFGLTILFVNFFIRKSVTARTRIVLLDVLLCILIGFIGGVITSTISIGVGEMLLILLFFRRFPIQVTIFMAVAISSITVLASAPYFIWVTQSVIWDVVMFAAPAAVIGGILGGMLAERLGATRIKIFCALWILFTGIIA